MTYRYFWADYDAKAPRPNGLWNAMQRAKQPGDYYVLMFSERTHKIDGAGFELVEFLELMGYPYSIMDMFDYAIAINLAQPEIGNILGWRCLNDDPNIPFYGDLEVNKHLNTLWNTADGREKEQNPFYLVKNWWALPTPSRWIPTNA